MKSFWIIFSTFIIFSCSSNITKQVVAQRDQVSEIYDKEELSKRMKEIIGSSKNLSKKQKVSFLTLHEEVVAEADKITIDMRKLKIVLFKSFTQDNYDAKKVREISKQLKKLINQKLDIMLSAMSKARKILGVEYKNIHPREDFLHSFRDSY